MAQNMSVSVTLKLQDQFTRPVRGLMQQLQRLTRTAQEFSRAVGGSSSNSPFGRMQEQVRAVAGDVRQLASQFSRLNRSMSAPTRGGFAASQVAGMRQLIGLQQTALANQTRLGAGGRGGGRGPIFHGGGGFWGRRGFSPNASLADRAQYRFVNFGEQSLASGFLDLDRARTNLAMLAMPRRDPNNPNQLLPGVITQDVVAEAEVAAAQLSQGFRVLNRAHILDTFREIVTQFKNTEDAFAFLPKLLNIQEWQVLQGDTVEQARSGMLSLVRAIGLSGRLVGNDGRLKMDEASGFLDTYLRARMIGGADVTPQQVFQVMKYLKASGQTFNQEALLTSFIAMPDLRGNTFGNQMNMMVRSLTGKTTQAAQAAMEAAGLGTRGERTQSGGHVFTPVDEVMLRENPFAWFQRHIMGATGLLRQRGLDPLRASSSQIAEILRPIFGNMSAENIANMIANQQSEWRNQIENSLRFNLTPEARRAHAQGSGWHQLTAARSAVQDALGAAAENFKLLLNPAIESATDKLKALAFWIDPRTGSPAASMALLGAGGFAGLWALRGIWGRMGPWGRAALGSGAGLFLGGTPTDVLMGALLGRQMGGAGGSAAGVAAAGAAGAVAGRAWGGRFMGAVRWIGRGLGSLLRGSIVWGVAGYAIQQVLENWGKLKTHMLAIFSELKQAAPTWLLGEGKGWRHFAESEAVTNAANDFRNSDPYARMKWLNDNVVEGPARNYLFGGDNSLKRFFDAYVEGRATWPSPGDGAAAAAAGRVTTVTTGSIITNVYVTQSNADPKTIGNAAGAAVKDALNQSAVDFGPMP